MTQLIFDLSILAYFSRPVDWNPEYNRAILLVLSTVLVGGGLLTLGAAFIFPKRLVSQSRNYRGKKAPEQRQRIVFQSFVVGAISLLAVGIAGFLYTNYRFPVS